MKRPLPTPRILGPYRYENYMNRFYKILMSLNITGSGIHATNSVFLKSRNFNMIMYDRMIYLKSLFVKYAGNDNPDFRTKYLSHMNDCYKRISEYKDKYL